MKKNQITLLLTFVSLNSVLTTDNSSPCGKYCFDTCEGVKKNKGEYFDCGATYSFLCIYKKSIEKMEEENILKLLHKLKTDLLIGTDGKDIFLRLEYAYIKSVKETKMRYVLSGVLPRRRK